MGALIVLLISLCALFSSWATYKQLGLFNGLTPITLPALMCLGLIITYYISNHILPKFSNADYCIIIIYLICLSSISWTLAEKVWPINIYYYSICFIIYFSVRFFVTTEVRIRVVGYGIIIGLIIAFLLTSERVSEWGVVLQRSSIEELNPNFTAYVVVGSLYLITIIKYLRIFPVWFKYTYYLLLFFIIYLVYSLGTRGAVISYIAIVSWYLSFKYIPKRFVNYITIVACLITIFISFGLLTDWLLVVEDVFVFGLFAERSTGNLAGRLDIWLEAINYINNNIFLGIGIGAFPSVSSSGIGSHNIILTLLLDIGGIGFIFFICYIYNLFLPALKQKASLENKFILGGFFSYWLPIATSGHWELMPFSWLIMGLTFNLLRYNTHRSLKIYGGK